VAGHPDHLRGQASWLDRHLDPGDYVVAGAFGQTGRVPRWEPPLTYVVTALWAVGATWWIAAMFAGEHPSNVLAPTFFVPCLVIAVPRWMRKPTYVAVTTRYVYLIRMSSDGRKPLYITLQTLVTSVGITSEQAGHRWRVIRFTGPDFPTDGRQFLVEGAARANVDSILAAVGSQPAVLS
jgi:hypothetical protein